MKKYSPEWHDINTLLSFLRSDNVIDLVKEYYGRFNNLAPSELLKNQIQKVQQRLDNEQ